MANMSYCRYENTSKDLRDCVNALYEADVNEPLSSSYEVRGLRELLFMAQEIVDMEDTITEILDNQ